MIVGPRTDKEYKMILREEARVARERVVYGKIGDMVIDNVDQGQGCHRPRRYISRYIVCHCGSPLRLTTRQAQRLIDALRTAIKDRAKP